MPTVHHPRFLILGLFEYFDHSSTANLFGWLRGCANAVEDECPKPEESRRVHRARIAINTFCWVSAPNKCGLLEGMALLAGSLLKISLKPPSSLPIHRRVFGT
jgi:hypothetical protein